MPTGAKPVPLGELEGNLKARFDEIELTADYEAMNRLELEALMVFKSWCHNMERVHKVKGELQYAIRWRHVADQLQREIVQGIEKKREAEVEE